MRCGIYVRVSTDYQRDNGYSIDSQLRMIKEYCEKNEYDIVDVYNDAGHSGKDLMRPEMQRLLKDIKSKKIDKLVAIKVDRLTHNNYDGFRLLNYSEEHDVKIELILEPYDVSTANGEMIFGMNLVFGQRERKEIGARTKRAMEEMALERIHPSKAPYGYIRNKETGHLEVEPIEAEVVKEIFELCKQGNSTRGIATIMKDNNAYLKQGKWKSDRVYKILSNSIYIGIFEYGKYKRKSQDILRVENYCEPIIDEVTWNATRNVLVKNKHSNYGEYIHLFSGLVKCPICGEIMSSSESFKYPNGKQKVYYHLRCKNHNCSGFGLHYNTEKIETKLKQVLEELTLFMLSMDNEIITCNSTKSDDVKDIEKAIEKLKLQKKRLVDLAGERLTLPGEGREVGPTLGINKQILEGLFFSPSVVASALKTAVLASKVLEELGYKVEPRYNDERVDIVQNIEFGNEEDLVKYCQGIQMASPVDSFAIPMPWDMPGYEDKVIMAAGTFTQGSSIELSCDGPIRKPYIAYMQGSLTYEYGKIAIIKSVSNLTK